MRNLELGAYFWLPHSMCLFNKGNKISLCLSIFFLSQKAACISYSGDFIVFMYKTTKSISKSAKAMFQHNAVWPVARPKNKIYTLSSVAEK